MYIWNVNVSKIHNAYLINTFCSTIHARWRIYASWLMQSLNCTYIHATSMHGYSWSTSKADSADFSAAIGHEWHDDLQSLSHVQICACSSSLTLHVPASLLGLMSQLQIQTGHLQLRSVVRSPHDAMKIQLLMSPSAPVPQIYQYVQLMMPYAICNSFMSSA